MSSFANNNQFNYSGDKSSLENLVQNYPYFSHAHFLLLQQMNENDENYKEVAAKTALHFANPFLLEQQLKQSDAIADIEIIHSVVQDAENDIEITTVSIVSVETDEFAEGLPPVEKKNIQPVIEENVVVIPDEIKQSNPKEETLLFEPLHTTDYFASQGIKLSEIVQPTDKMGKQLKSFTEWLKTMKKVHTEEQTQKILDKPLDAKVQNMAEKSNIEEEVVTESMAEVYLQQGKKQKAKEIYQKLSLLNPAKNAYFAAKLNEIQ